MDKKLDELYAPILCLPDLISVETIERNRGDAPAWEAGNIAAFDSYIPLSSVNFLELCNDLPVMEDVAFHPTNELWRP